MVDQAQREKIAQAPGFFAALDQSGGSTPKALALYGITADSYRNDAEMFDLVHTMRVRIMTNSAFDGRRILAAILFEMTMDREVEGRATADYLWSVKNVVPLLKVDQGLADVNAGVQLMKPIDGLDSLLARARSNGIFGTKMRSVIHDADRDGVREVVAQQFDVAQQILAAGLVPIIEPEISIESTTKRECEELLAEHIGDRLAELGADQQVMLKLTLPEHDDFYAPFVNNPKVLKVVALSGGYSRQEADERLARQHGVIASFSRALTEGLSVNQTDEEFTHTLDGSIQAIYDASVT